MTTGNGAPIDPTLVVLKPRRGLKAGDLLNGIFKVNRFVASGGMGEVFEGVNINSHERVAIKAILPEFAANPEIVEMFRREAQVLTRMSHAALVQYRVLAHEPQHDVLYIVTEYIEGVSLTNTILQGASSLDDTRMLIRRLAGGLRSAHDLGVVHRDISPDNIILEGGEINRARIIDFGIAKLVDPKIQTIVGEGFAGKLGYVAPEQLGDFGRRIGPWSDVYSLGLTILAVASGHDPKLGVTLADAIDERRAGIDTSVVPSALRPLLDAMLRPNPDDRLQSMDAVLAFLDAPVELPSQLPSFERAPPIVLPEKKQRSALPLVFGGAAAVVALGAAAWLVTRDTAPLPIRDGTIGLDAPARGQEIAITKLRPAIEQALSRLDCSWLDIDSIDTTTRGATIDLRGATGQFPEVRAAIVTASAAIGVSAVVGLDAVAPIDRSRCELIETLRKIRFAGTPRLTVSGREFEMRPQPKAPAARVTVDIAVDRIGGELALYGIEPNGEVSSIAFDRYAYARAKASGQQAPFGLDVTHLGWSGLLLLTSNDQAAAKLPKTLDNNIIVDSAAGWQAEIIWFRTVEPPHS